MSNIAVIYLLVKVSVTFQRGNWIVTYLHLDGYSVESMTSTSPLNFILLSPNRVTCVTIAKYLLLFCAAYFIDDGG